VYIGQNIAIDINISQLEVRGDIGLDADQEYPMGR
jgi:hypothetical protein